MLSCLFITYNRSELLKISVESIRSVVEQLGFDYEFIVSDDASMIRHQYIIETLDFDKKIYSDKNQGLGHNCNKGLYACRRPFILQLQDDWKFIGKPEDIRDALEILQSDAEIGVVQMNASFSDLPLKIRHTPSGVAYIVYKNDLAPWIRDSGTRPYSDQPHIKRKEFVEQVGPYREGVPMTIMEKEYQKRVANQRCWQVAKLLNTGDIFQHLGEDESFNPGVHNKGRFWRLRCLPAAEKALSFAHDIRRKIDIIAMCFFYKFRTWLACISTIWK